MCAFDWHAPNSSTLDDLAERPKRPLAELKSSYGALHKNFNEDRLRPTLSAAMCRPMDFVSSNIKYMGMGTP